ncbi:MAG: cbb3-type cytochrome c oxidase subunit I [Verrucomicrobia bacterium]|nr:cbb3-type cytochrome c oxidase subunit I [Verrucomicrobiota bacterium]
MGDTKHISQSASVVDPDRIDRSCRWPVVLLFTGAMSWLIIGLTMGLFSSIKMHAPGFWAQCEWVSYGRLRPAFMDAVLYGFAAQAALGCSLWMISRLSRVELRLSGIAGIGALALNAGVAFGVLQVLAGQTTGFTWMEIPRQGASIIVGGYALVALSALYTLHKREEKQLYVSVWFLLAGLLVFPWLMSLAYMLAVVEPLRGVMQAVVNAYFVNGMTYLWLTSMAMAVAYYLLPKVTGKPLRSHDSALLCFWTLVVFGGWSGLSLMADGPLPRWLLGVGVGAKWLIIVPAAAFTMDCLYTWFAGKTSANEGVAWPYVLFGSLSFPIFVLLDILSTIGPAPRTLLFTTYSQGILHFAVFGFAGLLFMGAIAHIWERILGGRFPKRLPFIAHLLLSLLGIVLISGSYLLGGVSVGGKLADPPVAFTAASSTMTLFIRSATTGYLALLLGQIILAVALLKSFATNTATIRAEFFQWCCGGRSPGSDKKARARA